MAARAKCILVTLVAAIALSAWQIRAWAVDTGGFPEGLDAVQAAPASHKVIFENALVRVLEVTVPPNGQTEPMHHHRWPSFFLDWDTGGNSPHIRYHQPAGVVHEQPGTHTPNHPGHWSIHWMPPEPLHAIETVDYEPTPGEPPSLRIEIKVSP
jgi:hypothetical protein